MNNTNIFLNNNIENTEILEINSNMLVDSTPQNKQDRELPIEINSNTLALENYQKREEDMEANFSYFNPFFIGLSIVLIVVFWMQIYHGFPTNESIDLKNFTYAHSSYGESWNSFGIFTSMFLHGGLEHISGNILFLYILSLPVYKLIGLYWSIGLFLLSGMTGSTLSYHFWSLPSIGASGGVFGLFWFLAIYYLIKKDVLSENVKDLSWVMLIVVIIQIYSWLTLDYVDNFAHFGGCFVGMLISYVYYGILKESV